MEYDEWSLGEDTEFDPNATDYVDEISHANHEEDYYVFCFGKNKDGELAQKHTRNLLEPEPLKQLKSKQIKFISSGREHTAVIDSNGYLYLCGSTLHGKLGIQKYVKSLTSFSIFPRSRQDRVKEVACGDYHTLCLLVDGRVFGWGGTLHKVKNDEKIKSGGSF